MQTLTAVLATDSSLAVTPSAQTLVYWQNTTQRVDVLFQDEAGDAQAFGGGAMLFQARTRSGALVLSREVVIDDDAAGEGHFLFVPGDDIDPAHLRYTMVFIPAGLDPPTYMVIAPSDLIVRATQYIPDEPITIPEEGTPLQQGPAVPLSDADPEPLGVEADPGVSEDAARADHVHPAPPTGRIYVRNWNSFTAYTLAAGSPAPVIGTDQRAWVDVTDALAALAYADWVALEAQRLASYGLEFAVEGSLYAGPLIAGNLSVPFIDHIARLPPAGFVHRVAQYRLSTGTFAANVTVQDSTRGAEHFYDSISSRNFWRAPDDAYHRRILSRGTRFLYPFNRTTASTTEPNAGWDTSTSRTAVPTGVSPTAAQTGIIPCSYGKSFFWNATTNTIRCGVLNSETITSMTLQFWYRPMSLDAPNGVGNGQGDTARLENDSSGVFVLKINSTTQITSLAPLVVGEVYMITVVNQVSGANIETLLYINGVLQGTFLGPTGFDPINASNYVLCGDVSTACTFYLQSLSIDFAVRDAATILADYNAGISSPAP